MWMDFRRADLKLCGKTLMDMFWRIHDSLWRSQEQWRLKTIFDATCHFRSLFISCPQLNGQYCLYYTIYMWHVCDRNRRGFCCKVAYFWAMSHQQVIVGLKIRHKKMCLLQIYSAYNLSNVFFLHLVENVINDISEATFN